MRDANEMQAETATDEAAETAALTSTDARGQWFMLGRFSSEVIANTRSILPMPFHDEPPGEKLRVIGYVVEIEGRGEPDDAGAVAMWARALFKPGATPPEAGAWHFFAPSRRQLRSASNGSTVTIHPATGTLLTIGDRRASVRVGPSDDERARMKKRRKAARDARKRNR